MPAPVDLVLTFKGTSHSFSKQKASEDIQSAEKEYTCLISTLKDAGLKATGRRGEGHSQLMVLIWAPPRKVSQLFQKQRHADFLLGLPSSLPGHSHTSAVKPLSRADRLRLVHDYVTSLKADGGLAIIPGVSQWPRVESILALHDSVFDHSWINTWTRRSIGFKVGFSELNKIRDEFGEAVSLYFAFLSSYTQSLFFPAFIGLLFWFFSSPYSPWYSAILTIWSVWWVEWWRIRQKALSVRWGTLGSFRAEKRRPHFRSETGKTAEATQAFPWWKRELRIVSSLPIILFFAGVLATILTAIFILEAFVTQFYRGPLHDYISFAPTILFVALVPRVLALYQALACKLTNWENHDHQSSYDASLTIKTFALSAIVAYLGLALSAFVYVPFGHLVMGSVQNYVLQVTSRGDGESTKSLFDTDIHKAQTKIDPSRLKDQMFAYSVTNQVVDTLHEIVLPYVMRGVDNVRNGKGVGGLRATKKVVFDDDTTESEEDRQFLHEIRRNIALPEYSLFGDYAEMITQFGYVAVWSTIWPLAPVMALLNNWFEIRSDAFKIATHVRRPLPVRVDTIGPWLDSMAFISWFGALTNSALVYIFRPQDGGPFSARFGTTLDAKGQPGSSTAWHTLIVPSLLVALSSSHGYLLARSIMRHLMDRAFWRGSDEERLLQNAQDEVKSFYLQQARDEEEMSDLAVAQLTKGSQDTSDQIAFWEQDEGLEELRRAAKMT